MRGCVSQVDRLIAINKHLRRAISYFDSNDVYIGSLTEQRKLIKLKFRLEEILELTIKREIQAKKSVFRKLKR